MFNEERKMRFIEERKDEAVLPAGYLENQFNKVKDMETELNKDLCNFTAYEIKEYYKMLGIASIQSLTVMNSQFSLYTNWCLQHNLVKDNQNHFLEITYDMLNDCINKALLDMKVVTRQTIISWINKLENPQDKFIILALFEGIKGKEKCELAKLRPEDISGNIATLCTGRKIEISDELVGIIKDCINTDEYYSKSGKTYKFIDTGYIIKDIFNAKEEVDSYQLGRRIYYSIRRTMKMLDKTNIITATSIVESGKLDMIKRRSDELGINVKEYIYSDYIKEVEEKYDCTIIDTVYFRKYKDYLD